MSPITLAYIIMGDGGYNKDMNIIRIYTYNFTLDDCHRLAISISNLGINTQVQYDRTGKSGDKQYILKIDSTQLDTVRVMVLPYMDPSMYYRLGL